MAPEEIVKKLLNEIIFSLKLVNPTIKVIPISSGGANYSSVLYNISIIEHDQDYQLFAKVTAITQTARSQIPFDPFKTEYLAYTKLFNIYRELEDAHNIKVEDRIAFPKCYGFNTNHMEETVVLENLSSRGLQVYDRLLSIDWPFASAAVTELAKLHALSAAFQHERLDEFEEFTKNISIDWAALPKEPTFTRFWMQVAETAANIIREENKDKLKKFFEKEPWISGYGEPFGYYRKPLKRKFIVHSDYRSSNLMYKVHEDGRAEVIPVDYQTLEPGSPAADLIFFIFTSSDEQFRAQYFSQLMQHYHAEFSAALQRLQLDPEQVYSWEDFQMEVKEKLPYGLGLAAFSLPIITVNAENAPNLEDGLTSIIEVQSENKTLLVDRMNGVVDDYVRWGVL